MICGLSLLVLIRAYPVFEITVDTWNMKNSLPLLSSFESPFDMSRISGNVIAIDRVKSHETDGKFSLKAILFPGEYPGISLNYFQNDWRGYRSLSFDAFLEKYSHLEITVQVNDRNHYTQYTGRFNKSFHLLPGANHIIIDLKDIMKAPKGRHMNMAEITNISIFAYRLKERSTIYFDNFRLEGHS